MPTPDAQNSADLSKTPEKNASSPGVQGVRSRLGCQTCRDKKVKCDERRPRCQRCTRLNRNCDYTSRPRKKYTRQNRSPPNNEVPQASRDAENSTSTRELEQHESTLTQQTLCAPCPETVTPQLQSMSPPLSGDYYHLDLNVIALSEYDQDAIHYFRYIMAPRVDTKTPQYSGPALIWTLSQKDPMVLHMVCALGSLQLCNDISHSSHISDRKSEAVVHYGAALRLLSTAIQDLKEVSDLDYILGTLWLMVSYELAFGDGTGAHLLVHLRGAALLLRERLANIRNMTNLPQIQKSANERKYKFSCPDLGIPGITCFSSQLLVWLSLVDGSAALNGMNTSFNDIFGEITKGLPGDETLSRLFGFRVLQRYATMVNKEVWGADYPQSELIADLQCSEIFCLQAETSQLRYMIARLAHDGDLHPSAKAKNSESLASAIEDVGLRYSDILTAASLLDLPGNETQKGYVLNLRAIVPFYYAVVLLHYSLFDALKASADKREMSVREIMTIAYRAYSDEGSKAMHKIAWALYIVALELDDMIYRAWVLERLDELAKDGENFRRAQKALLAALSYQRSPEKRITYLDLVQDIRIDPFVL